MHVILLGETKLASKKASAFPLLRLRRQGSAGVPYRGTLRSSLGATLSVHEDLLAYTEYNNTTPARATEMRLVLPAEELRIFGFYYIRTTAGHCSDIIVSADSAVWGPK